MFLFEKQIFRHTTIFFRSVQIVDKYRVVSKCACVSETIMFISARVTHMVRFSKLTEWSRNIFIISTIMGAFFRLSKVNRPGRSTKCHTEILVVLIL